jgi:plasmid stabilization system protein ParE
MRPQKLKVWKTPAAHAKLKEIYTYSCKKWGKKTAQNYMTALDKTIESVAAGTKHTKINPSFNTRFSYCVYKRHYLFFEYRGDKLIIATIFHTMQSIEDRMVEEIPVIQQEIDK